MPDQPLGIKGFNFSDLYDPLRLKALNREFWKFAEANKAGIEARFQGAAALPKPKESEVLIEVAHQVGHFLAELFQIQPHTKALIDDAESRSPAFRFKRDVLSLKPSLNLKW